MRLRNTHAIVLAGLVALAPGQGLWGASPQEGRMPRPRPQAPRESAPTPSAGPAGNVEGRVSRPGGSRSSEGPMPGIEGRVPRPGPVHRTQDEAITLTRVGLYPGTRVVIPPPFDRCRVQPTFDYWRRRDLMAEIQWLSRRGFVPVTPLGDSVDALTDYVQTPSGWRAYGIPVPAGGTVQVAVEHGNLGWFRLMLVDKWGKPGPGMLQAAIAHQPVLVTYKNPGKEATAVYVIVDDPAWWSDAKNPYTLRVRRDWDPATTDLSRVKLVAGLWGASPSVSAEFRGPSLTGPAVYPH